jgi:hypothetical protein
VENANTLILTAIKKIWSHNTSICIATKFTPFKLLYGEEPVTPEEIKLRSTRTNTEAIHCHFEAKSKDLLEPRVHEGGRKPTVLPKWNKSMERQKSKAKTHRSRGSGSAVEHPHRSFSETGT